MRPSPAGDNKPNGRTYDSIIMSQAGLRFSQEKALFDTNHFGFGKLGIRVMDSVCRAALGSTVGHIVSGRACPEMFRAAARRVITRMKHKDLVWYRPVGENIGNAVGAAILSLMGDNPVAFLGSATLPNPTSAGLVDPGPEMLDVFCGKLMVHAEPSFQCVTPPAVSAVRGLLARV